MTTEVNATARSRRLRNALLASALTLGVAGGTGAIVFGDGPTAKAEAVHVDVAAPADFSAVVEKVKPAVVSVRVKGDLEPVADRDSDAFPDLPDDSPFNEFFKRFQQSPRGQGGPGHMMPRKGHVMMGQGSGFFVSDDGFIVTNNHVVDHAKEFTVVTDDGRELTAKLIGKDDKTDLAVLKVEGTGFPYVTFASDEPKIGQWAIAVGNPFGLGGSVTAGIVSAEGRDIGSGPYDDFIQIDTAVNRGNSGGPTFNTQGEVIGVNTAIFSPSGGNVGIAFAIPASEVKEVVSDLRNSGSITRGWLGVAIQPVSGDIADSLGIKSTDGALVSDPQDNGPGMKAGIKAGDIITQVDGKPVKGPRELARMISHYEPNQKVIVTLVRDGKEQQIDVMLGKLGDQVASKDGGSDESPAQATSLDALGLTLEANPNGDGVAVASVEDGSTAADKGFQTGDVIVSVAGKPVDSAGAVQAGIKAAAKEGRKAVLMQVQNDQGTRFVALPIDQG